MEGGTSRGGAGGGAARRAALFHPMRQNRRRTDQGRAPPRAPSFGTSPGDTSYLLGPSGGRCCAGRCANRSWRRKRLRPCMARHRRQTFGPEIDANVDLRCIRPTSKADVFGEIRRKCLRPFTGPARTQTFASRMRNGAALRAALIHPTHRGTSQEGKQGAHAPARLLHTAITESRQALFLVGRALAQRAAPTTAPSRSRYSDAITRRSKWR